MQGTVKWFNDPKGYGFLQTPRGDNAFVHYNDIEMEGHRTLQEGQTVEFELMHGPKGLFAASVRVISGPDSSPSAQGEGESKRLKEQTWKAEQ